MKKSGVMYAVILIFCLVVFTDAAKGVNKTIHSLTNEQITLSWLTEEPESCEMIHTSNNTEVWVMIVDEQEQRFFKNGSNDITEKQFSDSWGWHTLSSTSPCLKGISKKVTVDDAGQYYVQYSKTHRYLKTGTTSIVVNNADELTLSVMVGDRVSTFSLAEGLDIGPLSTFPYNGSISHMKVQLGEAFPPDTNITINDHFCRNTTTCTGGLCGNDVMVVIETSIRGARRITIKQPVAIEHAHTGASCNAGAIVGCVLGVIVLVLLVCLVVYVLKFRNNKKTKKMGKIEEGIKLLPNEDDAIREELDSLKAEYASIILKENIAKPKWDKVHTELCTVNEKYKKLSVDIVNLKKISDEQEQNDRSESQILQMTKLKKLSDELGLQKHAQLIRNIEACYPDESLYSSDGDGRVKLQRQIGQKHLLNEKPVLIDDYMACLARFNLAFDGDIERVKHLNNGWKHEMTKTEKEEKENKNEQG